MWFREVFSSVAFDSRVFSWSTVVPSGRNEATDNACLRLEVFPHIHAVMLVSFSYRRQFRMMAPPFQEALDR